MSTINILNCNDLELRNQLSNLDTMNKLKLASSLLLEREKKERNFNAVVKIMTMRKMVDKKLKTMQKEENSIELELHNRKDLE